MIARSFFAFLPTLAVMSLAGSAAAQDPDPAPPAQTSSSDSAGEAPGDGAGAPATPNGWNVGGGVYSQGIFDPGMKLFSSNRYVTVFEVRAGRDLASGDGFLRVTQEGAYALSRSIHSLGLASKGDLILQRAGFGLRASIPTPVTPGIRVFARGGAAALHATALVHDPYRDHREEALAFGGYAAGGLDVDAGPLMNPGQHLHLAVEAGHFATTDLALGRMGRLEVNGIFYGASASVRF